MAKVTSKNVLLHGLSGSIGDLVFRQMPDDSTQVQRTFFSGKPERPQSVWSQNGAMPYETKCVAPAMRSQWCNCNAKGKMTLNLKLVMGQRQFIDHGIVHELCHLIEHNHSAAFYALMLISYKRWSEKSTNSFVSRGRRFPLKANRPGTAARRADRHCSCIYPFTDPYTIRATA